MASNSSSSGPGVVGMDPEQRRSIALDLEGRLVPFLKVRPRVRSWKRSHQLSALSPARRVQWIRAARWLAGGNGGGMGKLTLLAGAEADDLAV
jgi:hypothetical protein